MVFVGGEVKDFELDAFQKGDLIKLRLSDFRGKWLVIFFYPADFTFICPTELEELADNYGEFCKAGAEILSVSTDTAYAHKAWHDSSPAIRKICFPMVADPTGNLAREFGIYLKEEGLALRGSFIIDPDGVLKALEVHDNNIGRSAKELLRKVHAAKFIRENKGVVCQASWMPGMDGIRKDAGLVGKI